MMKVYLVQQNILFAFLTSRIWKLSMRDDGSNLPIEKAKQRGGAESIDLITVAILHVNTIQVGRSDAMWMD